MDFYNAPIADFENDEVSLSSISHDEFEEPVEGVLKRTISDPFDIARGLRLDASLENLVWTFDEDVLGSGGDSLDSPQLNTGKEERRKDAALAAVK